MQAYVDGQLLIEFLRTHHAEQTVTLALHANRATNFYQAKWCAYKKQHRLRCINEAQDAIFLRLDCEKSRELNRMYHATRP